MATTITINGSVTLDESLGLQNSGIPNPVSGEDNNDSDVSLATLQSAVAAFSNRLFNSVATGGLGLSTTFATNNGVAESASNFITVSGGTVASLGFVDGNGGGLKDAERIERWRHSFQQPSSRTLGRVLTPF